MSKRTQRALHAHEAKEMQSEVREFRRHLSQWAARLPIGTTAHLGCDILTYSLILMDMQLTAAIDAAPYERPSGFGGMDS